MGAVSVERNVVTFLCQTLDIGTGIRAAVHHQCNIQLFEAAILDHLDLATEGFLCRSSIYH